MVRREVKRGVRGEAEVVEAAWVHLGQGEEEALLNRESELLH